MPHARAYGAVLAAVLLAPAASAGPALDVRELSAPGSLTDLAPGDSAEWAVEVTNSGASPRGVSVGFAVDAPGALAADPRDGLQLVVELCDSAFTVSEVAVGGGRSVERYLCPGGATPLGAGPAAALGRLDGVRPVERGATAGLRVRVLFPESAGTELENSTASLRVVVGDTGAAAPPAAAPPSGGLAVTGRDLGAALLGGVLALGAGALLAAAARRRRKARA